MLFLLQFHKDDEVLLNAVDDLRTGFTVLALNVRNKFIVAINGRTCSK